MLSSKTGLIDRLRQQRRDVKGLKQEYRKWKERGYSAPLPSDIKRATLLRLGVADATWVETGTFMGDTAALLAQTSRLVYTIEPESALYKNAEERFQADPKVRVIHGLSEKIFPDLLPTLSGWINFWLDGHYSGGVTFKGPTDCPVVHELAAVEANLAKFEGVTVIIDDIRCFDPADPVYKDYPSKDYLVDWARRNALVWNFENDMFIAQTNGTKHGA